MCMIRAAILGIIIGQSHLKIKDDAIRLILKKTHNIVKYIESHHHGYCVIVSLSSVYFVFFVEIFY